MHDLADFGFSGVGIDVTAIDARAEISASALARILGIETAELARLANRGICERRDARGCYGLEKSVLGYCTMLRERTSDKPRDRLDTIKAETAQVELEQLLGNLVALDSAQRKLCDVVTAARRYLEGIGARIAPQLAEKTNPAEIRTTIDSEIATALEQIANERLEKPADTDKSETPPRESPKTDGGNA